MIKILQVSDFHFINDPDGINFQKLLLRKAKEEFAKIEKNKKLLVITGDFHFWNETDYDESLKYIRALVGAMDIEMNSDVFLVPGNHDVCSSEDDLQAIGQKSIVEMVKNDHKALHDKGKKNLPRLLTRFEKYSKFCTDLGIYTDASLPATVHVRSWGNRVNFIHLNTCLIADGVEKINQLLDTTSLTSLENENGLPCIVLGHNSFFDLAEKVQAQVTPAFDRLGVRAYLCGDRHRYEKNRYQYDINLDGERGKHRYIPNIVCCRSSADENDDYSDVGCIIHKWDETTGEVSFDVLTWDSVNNQDVFYSHSDHGTYDLGIPNLDPNSHDLNSAGKGVPQREDNALEKSEKAVIEKYHNYIRNNCTEIELNGLPTPEAELKRKYELSKLFVPLRFITSSSTIDEDAEIQTVRVTEGQLELSFRPTSRSKTSPLEEAIVPLSYEDYSSIFLSGKLPSNLSKRISIEELIPSESHFTYLILANPGAGKTTLLKRIASAYCFPEEYLKDSGFANRTLFPVWIRCRDITDNDYSIWKEIQSIPQKGELSLEDNFSTAFSSIVKAHIENGTALLLIDGLDEIGSERGRKRFVEHLNDFIKNNPKLNVIITSREKGFSIISEGAFNDFTTFRIDNLDKDGINILCSKWFSLVYGESERVKKNKDELVNRIIYDKRIRQLATNPLMLTTLLLVDHNTNSLPTKRVGLYYEATKVLLETWKKDEYTDSLKIDHDQAKNQLAYVAFQMTTNRKKYKNKIREDELKTLLNNVRDECSNLVSRNGLSVGEVISIIQQRSALIAKTEDVKLYDGHYESVYEFMHPTFQEYLAAYAVSIGCYPGVNKRNKKGKVLNKYLADEDMKEVILLAATIDPDCATNLADAVYKKIDTVKAESERIKLRTLLLNMFADEAGIDEKNVYTYFKAVIGNALYPSYKDLLKQIVAGRYKQNLKDFFEKTDNEICEGYDGFTSVYEILSGEISDVLEFYHKNSCADDAKLRAKALSVLSSWSYLGFESSIVRNDEIGNEIRLSVFKALGDENWHVAASGFELLKLCDLISDKEGFARYINSLCNYINRFNRIPHIIEPSVLQRYLEGGLEMSASLDNHALDYICNGIKEHSMLSSDDYFDEMVLLLTVSFCASDVKRIESFYNDLAEKRPDNLGLTQKLKEIQLINKLAETICSSKKTTDTAKRCIGKYMSNVMNSIPRDKLKMLRPQLQAFGFADSGAEMNNVS